MFGFSWKGGILHLYLTLRCLHLDKPAEASLFFQVLVLWITVSHNLGDFQSTEPCSLQSTDFWEGSVCRQGFGDGWWIMMQQLIMTWSVNAAGQESVQDMKDGSIHINMDAWGLLIYGVPLTPVRSSSGELITLWIYFLFMQAPCHSLLLSLLILMYYYPFFAFTVLSISTKVRREPVKTTLTDKLAVAPIKTCNLTGCYRMISVIPEWFIMNHIKTKKIPLFLQNKYSLLR